MKRHDDLQKILEAIAKSGIKVEGDFVAQKNVEYEVVGVDAGGIGIQINGTCKKLTKTEEEIYTAIENLQKDKNDEGKFIMYDFDQWYAIFRVLSQFCGYPSKPKDFEKSMRNIGSDDLRIPCKYDNFRKVTLNKLPMNVALWSQYLKTADQYSQKQLIVAITLMEKLNIE